MQLRFTILLLAVCVLSSPLLAQQSEMKDALQAFKNERHDQVLLILDDIQHPEARILKGKSLYALGQYNQALRLLRNLEEVLSPNLIDDANFTSALCYIQLRNYTQALRLLRTVKVRTRDTDLVQRAGRLYDQLLSFVSLEQRLDLFRTDIEDPIKVDIVRSAIPLVSPTTGKLLLQSLQNVLGEHLPQLDAQQLSAMLENRTFVKKEHEQVGTAPDGFVYQLGIALPAVPTTDPDYEIFQALYFGALMAVEDYNQRNSKHKAFLHFKKTTQQADDGSIVADLAWNHRIDAIIGPLMSSSASLMAPMAEHYQIPMLAPLANSDSLNIDNPYFFQMNPTFSVLGQRMAQFAVKHLKYDTLAVIADYKEQDMDAAIAFKDEVQRLGAHIAYFLTEDFEALNYDIADLTKVFVGDQLVRDSLGYKRVDAVFVPFTSTTAPIMMDLILTDLEAQNSSVTILGTSHLNSLEVDPSRMDKFTFYMVDVFNPDEQSDQWLFFNSDYSLRFEVSPNRFSYVGFDAANYLLQTLEKVHNPNLLKNAIRTSGRYQGLSNAIHFKNTHKNHAVEFYSITSKDKKRITTRF